MTNALSFPLFFISCILMLGWVAAGATGRGFETGISLQMASIFVICVAIYGEVRDPYEGESEDE